MAARPPPRLTLLGARAGRPRSQEFGIGEPQAGPSGQVGRREAAEALARSAARGRELARLLDPDTHVPGVTSGTLRPEAAAIAVPATIDGRNMAGDDFALSAGWGHLGAGGAVMPVQGRIVERAFTPEERATPGDALPVLGKTTSRGPRPDTSAHTQEHRNSDFRLHRVPLQSEFLAQGSYPVSL